MAKTPHTTNIFRRYTTLVMSGGYWHINNRRIVSEEGTNHEFTQPLSLEVMKGLVSVGESVIWFWLFKSHVGMFGNFCDRWCWISWCRESRIGLWRGLAECAGGLSVRCELCFNIDIPISKQYSFSDVQGWPVAARHLSGRQWRLELGLGNTGLDSSKREEQFLPI